MSIFRLNYVYFSNKLRIGNQKLLDAFNFCESSRKIVKYFYYIILLHKT